MTETDNTPRTTSDRMYVLDGGAPQVEDICTWSPGVNEGCAHAFSNHVYLIRHRAEWMVWDTGLDDNMIRTPEGQVVAHGVRGVVHRTLASQFDDLGLPPKDVAVLAFSHAHFDHVGNSRLFTGARWLVQRTEHQAMFGGDHERYGFLPELYASMRDNPTTLLDGDYDVFGDGSVHILSTPGHTPGHQSLLVRLPQAGDLILSGDIAHFAENFRHRRVPKFNADHEATVASMDRIATLVEGQEAQLLINHDARQSALTRCVPDAIR